MAEPVLQFQRVRLIFVWMSVTVGAVILFALLFGGAMFGYDRLYQNKMFPGARILDVRLDGLTKSEARATLLKEIDAELSKGLRLTYREKEVVLDAVSVSTDPDASRDLIRISPDAALDQAFALGRIGGWQKRFATQMHMRILPIQLLPDIHIDEPAIRDAIHLALRKEVTLSHNAKFHVDVGTDPPTVRVVPEQSGVELILRDTFAELRRQTERLDFRPILIRDRPIAPTILARDLESLRPELEQFIHRPPIQLTYEHSTFHIPHSIFFDWPTVTGTPGALEMTIDPDAFATGLKKVAGGIETEAKNGSLVITNGKIESFVAGTEGIEIDTNAMYRAVAAQWPATTTFPLIVRKTYGTLLGEAPAELGIREMIGVGRSNFSGSPENRRKNIAHGVSLVNGTIIKPGETFSLLKTLGPIDGEHKWLPELVIKGNVTKPEFGGGLCQIGTTTFRSALASGLPIVERQNHSYRVRYYEPAGTDATIYESKPDFRFMNDTGAHILINAYTSRDRVVFEFWGTNDGRRIEQTQSHIYNIVPPPPMKLVETLELAPGKKKCTEIAHAGADASFVYTVTSPTGEVKKETFRSHYRPWQAVCLVGVEKLSVPLESASSTLSGESAVGN